MQIHTWVHMHTLTHMYTYAHTYTMRHVAVSYVHSKYDNMHKNGMFYALICLNNHVISCYQIALFDLSHMMSMTNHVAISVETHMIDSKCSLEKEFTELIYMNL